jgi:hypothetical protein
VAGSPRYGTPLMVSQPMPTLSMSASPRQMSGAPLPPESTNAAVPRLACGSKPMMSL